LAHLDKLRISRRATLACVLLFGLVAMPGICACTSAQSDTGLSAEDARQAYEEGDFAGATQRAEAIVSDDPGNLDARRVLALALAAQGDNEGAIEHYVYVLEKQPEDHVTLYQVAMLERVIGRTGDAIGHLEAAVALKSDPSYLDDLARTYMQVGRYEEAAKLWGRVLEDEDLDETSRVELLVLQADAYEDARMYDEARGALEKALFLDPNNEELKERIKALE